MKRREETDRFIAAAIFAALAGSLLGLYISIVFAGDLLGSAVRTSCVVSPIGGFIGLTTWFRSSYRNRGNALPAAIPYLAFFIPAYFLPDYLVGAGPSFLMSAAILFVAVTCFALLRLLAFARHASRFESWASDNSCKIIALAFIAFTIAVVGYGAVRYITFAYPGTDLGIFIQSFWTALHGKLFWNTHEIYPGASRFGKQFSPIMFLILPCFKLFPHGMTIISLDAVVLGLAGVVVYFLARDLLGRYAGLCFGLCFFMYPGIAYSARSAYYFMHYAPLFLLLSFYYFRKERFSLFCLFLVLACSTREDITLTVFMFGVYALIRRKRARWVLFPIVLSTVWFLIAVVIVVPALGTGTMWEFYADSGGSLEGILLQMVRNPRYLMQKFFAPDNVKLLYLVLMPLGLIPPIMSLEFIFALPTLAIVGLSSMEHTRFIYGYYYMPLIPFIFASSIMAVRRLSSGTTLASLESAKRAHLLCTFLLFLSMAVFIRGPLAETCTGELTRPYNVRSGKGYNETLRRVIGLIPPEASVFTPRYLMPHLAKRMFVACQQPEAAEYLIIDTRTEDPRTASIQGSAFLRGIEGNPAYEKLFGEKGVRLYRRKGR